MKKSLLMLAACTAACLSPVARATDFTVYKVALKIPVVYVDSVGGADKVATLTLKGDDFVNIVLGRNLGTPVSKTKEILAIAGNDESNIGMVGPKSHLILYDLELHQPVAGIPHLADVTTVSFEEAYGIHKAFGSAKINVPAHTATDPDKGTIFATTFAGASAGGGKSKSPLANLYNVNLHVGITSGSGRLKVTFTDKTGIVKTINGFMLNGTATVSGLSLDKFTE